MIRRPPRVEIAESFEWYHDRSAVAAADFLAELDVAINQISEAPEQFPFVHGLLRRVLVRRFPYAVYYKCYPKGVSVVGVIHGHRHPATWLRRSGPQRRFVLTATLSKRPLRDRISWGCPQHKPT